MYFISFTNFLLGVAYSITAATKARQKRPQTNNAKKNLTQKTPNDHTDYLRHPYMFIPFIELQHTHAIHVSPFSGMENIYKAALQAEAVILCFLIRQEGFLSLCNWYKLPIRSPSKPTGWWKCDCLSALQCYRFALLYSKSIIPQPHKLALKEA